MQCGGRPLAHARGYRMDCPWERACSRHSGWVVASKHAPTKKMPHLFVSFDLDVLDAAHAPGVSATNPAGWTVREAAAWVGISRVLLNLDEFITRE